MVDYLIVGAGFAGSVCAERLASAGKTVLVVDQRAHIGGNAYDYYDEAGILVHKYGAHIFHTNNKEVFDYLSRFTEWHPYQHRVMARVGDHFVPMPINTTTLAQFGGDLQAAKRALIEPYTRKQWGPHADDLEPSVLARIRTRDDDEDRYFLDVYQGLPLHGYTRLFERLLAHPNIHLMLKTSYREVCDLLTDGGRVLPRRPAVIYTGPIDEFFDYRFGRLPYRSARFVWSTTSRLEYAQEFAVINLPDPDHQYTRVVEFKRLTGQVHRSTTRSWEYPTADGEPYWPVPTAASAALYQQYAALAKQIPEVYFLGRLGSYKYLDMHQVVAQALRLSTRLLGGDLTPVIDSDYS